MIKFLGNRMAISLIGLSLNLFLKYILPYHFTESRCCNWEKFGLISHAEFRSNKIHSTLIPYKGGIKIQ